MAQAPALSSHINYVVELWFYAILRGRICINDESDQEPISRRLYLYTNSSSQPFPE